MVDTPRLGVVASPVDMFVQTNEGNKAAQLAQALRGLAPALDGFGQAASEQIIEGEEQRARQEALRLNASEWQAAVRSGERRPGESPWFRRAYDQQVGRLFGASLQQSAAVAYQQWDGKDSDDPQAFTQFLSEFVSQQLEGVNNPDVLAGIEPELRILQNNLGQEQARRTAERIEQRTVENTTTEIGLILRDFQGGAEEFAQRLDGLRQTFRATGFPLSQLDGAVLAAVEAEAYRRVSTGDPTAQQVLSLLDAPRPDGTPPLSAIPAYRTRIERIREEVNQREFFRERQEQEEHERRFRQLSIQGKDEANNLLASFGPDIFAGRVPTQRMVADMQSRGVPAPVIAQALNEIQGVVADSLSLARAQQMNDLGVTQLYSTARRDGWSTEFQSELDEALLTGRISVDDHIRFFETAVDQTERTQDRAQTRVARRSGGSSQNATWLNRQIDQVVALQVVDGFVSESGRAGFEASLRDGALAHLARNPEDYRGALSAGLQRASARTQTPARPTPSQPPRRPVENPLR